MDPRKRNIIRAQPKVVGMPRNEFGTRRSSRVTCSKCQKVDYVPVKTSDKSDQLCRDCAEKILATYDQGRQIVEKKVTRTCHQCLRSFAVNEALTKKRDDLLCNDCLRGFEVWRGSPRARRSSTTTRRILVKVGSKTSFRKNANDTI